MIKVEGYKVFRGAMRIVPKNGFNPFELEGEWLYKPDTGCWYCNGRSFSEDICEVAEDNS